MILATCCQVEMPFLHIAGHGGNIYAIERLLLRLAKVDTDFSTPVVITRMSA